MKKLVLFAVMLLPALCYAGTTDYYNLQHYSVVPDTNNATNEYYYRGGFHVGYDTQTLLAPDINTQFDVHRSSIVFSSTTYLSDDINLRIGNNSDFVLYYNASTGELRISTSTITTDYGASLWRITDSSYVVIGSTGSFVTLDGKGDFGIAGELEVRDNSRFGGNGVIEPSKEWIMQDGARLYFGTGIDIHWLWDDSDQRLEIRTAGNINLYEVYTSSVVFTTHTVVNAPFGLKPMTEAELKSYTPSGENESYWDSTNKAVVISTGNTTGAFGLIYDGSLAPTGW